MSFREPWRWDPADGRWHRIVVHTDGSVTSESAQDCTNVIAHVREQERKRDNIFGMERIASVPLELINRWHNQGYPVFDPNIGDHVVLELVRRHCSKLRTVADKGA